MKFYMAVKHSACEFCDIIWESVPDMFNRKNKDTYIYQIKVYKNNI